MRTYQRLISFFIIICVTAALAPLPAAADDTASRNQVPLYFQNDYPDVRYGNGTIATSGCGLVSLAMVATYMTGHAYSPDELAPYFGGAAENNIARLEYGSEYLELAFEKSENFDKTMEALQEGKIAIALVDSDSPFTDSQHFIVLTGLTRDGKILVNDSYAPNYTKWELKQGFREGFPKSTILQGYSGAWIYDQSAMPEDPYILEPEQPYGGDPRYPEIYLSASEVELLARVVWVESRGECKEGQQAVAEVVLNRLASSDFPNDLNSVIYAQDQFRSVPHLDDAEPTQAQYDAIIRAYYGPYVLPNDVVYFARTAKTSKVWGQIGGHVFCFPEDFEK